MHFARPVVGRYQALSAFRTAARLAPADPEPLYWQMRVGFYLGSDEGERYAREAILRIFALAPDYADAWDRFQSLYRDRAIWRQAEAALARHPDDGLALERRAELAIALEEPERAELLLAAAAARRAAGPAAWLLRAEASFLAGDDARGYAWHDSALARAEWDSGGALWSRAWLIASPDEEAAYTSTPPWELAAFYRAFWARRDPNLLTPENERVAEQFQRMAHVRRQFRLIHPLNLYFRSAAARTLINMSGRGQLADEVAVNPDLLPLTSTDRRLAEMGLGPDSRSVNGSSMGVAGIDARGLIYMRHGPPDLLLAGYFDPLRPFEASSVLDAEGWLYRTPQGPVSIGFRRGTGDLMGITLGAGDFMFFPITSRQAYDTRVALETDGSALPAPLLAHSWTAFFRNAVPGLVDVYARGGPGRAAFAVWDANAGAAGPVAGAGVLDLILFPGIYTMGLDVDSSGVLGRLRGPLLVPSFPAARLTLSSLALAVADTAADRRTTLAGMPADLVYPADRPLAAYAEVYGLTPDSSGHVRYRVRYTVAPTGFMARWFGGGEAVFEFEREAVADDAVAERLVIAPERLGPGRYRVSLAVTDLVRNVKSEAAALDIVRR